MRSVRLFTPTNRLASVIGGPKDPTALELATAADARIGDLRTRNAEHVRTMAATILRTAAQPDLVVFRDRETLAAAARSLCEVAAFAGHRESGAVAQGIYVLLDAFHRLSFWNIDALRVHLDAFAFLNNSIWPTGSDIEQILMHLKTLRDEVCDLE